MFLWGRREGLLLCSFVKWKDGFEFSIDTQVLLTENIHCWNKAIKCKCTSLRLYYHCRSTRNRFMHYD